ncbi:MAG: ester cyclase [Paracoccaceae bacterium]
MSISQAAAQRLAEDYTAAWNTGDPARVAAFFAPTGGIVINRGTPWVGREGVAAMAAGFYADVPDLVLACDGIRVTGDHMVYLWTFTGTHSGTGRALRIEGMEEWDLTAEGWVQASRGWFDPEEWARQTA